jgi:hypothetical protein
MLKIKHANDRGFNKIEWLESYHSFSFGNYYDPKNMNFAHLRVINDDKIAPQSGFGFHSHKNMEIITFMLKGSIQHKDNLGNVGNLQQGNVQLMRAGTGITHSEMNLLEKEAHLLQIWVTPEQNNLTPGWWEKEFQSGKGNEIIVEPIYKENKIHNLNSHIHGNGLTMAQNGYIIRITETINLDFIPFGTSDIYYHQANGEALIKEKNEYELKSGDAAFGRVDNTVVITPKEDSLGLLFIFPA